MFGYLVKPFREADLLPAIKAARARHEELAALREEAESLAEALAARKSIERAKGLLMAKEGLSEQEAFERLRRASQLAGRPLKVVAEALIATFESACRRRRSRPSYRLAQPLDARVPLDPDHVANRRPGTLAAASSVRDRARRSARRIGLRVALVGDPSRRGRRRVGAPVRVALELGRSSSSSRRGSRAAGGRSRRGTARPSAPSSEVVGS